MNNLTFIDIKNNKESNKKVIKLYKEAFPKEEQIPIWFLKKLARKNRIILCIEHMDKNSNNYEQRKKRKEFYMKNGFKEANYFGKILYNHFYKKL